MPSPPDDPQRDLVYLMEKHELRGQCRGVTSLKTLRNIARSLCIRYKVPQVRVISRSERGYSATYDQENFLVRLHPKWGRNLLTLCHEVAHHATWCYSRRAQDHGPTFVRIYAEMIDMMRLVPFAGTKDVCRKYGIRMARRGWRS